MGGGEPCPVSSEAYGGNSDPAVSVICESAQEELKLVISERSERNLFAAKLEWESSYKLWKAVGLEGGMQKLINALQQIADTATIYSHSNIVYRDDLVKMEWIGKDIVVSVISSDLPSDLDGLSFPKK